MGLKRLSGEKQPKSDPGGDDGRLSIPPEFQQDWRQAQEGEKCYQQTGQIEALDAAAQTWERILAQASFGSASVSFQLETMNDAGGVFLRRYWRGGQLADLTRALQLWQKAVTLTQLDSPDLPMYLTNLGTGLLDRYSRTGALEDLEEAIRLKQQAVALNSRDSPNQPALLNNLGGGLWTRYSRTGALEDLEEAIRVSLQVVALTPADSPDLPMYLTNLGTGLRNRYSRTGALGDLEEAIRVYQQAVALTPPDAPDRPMYLNNLGNGLNARYDCMGVLEDLEEAVRVSRQAVALTPPDSPDRPMYLTNLGGGLWTRYNRTGAIEDLEEAIRVSRQAVALTPPDAPELPRHLNNLGTGLRNRYRHTEALDDLSEAIACYRQTCELGSLASQEMTLLSSRTWGNWALERGAWEEACQAYAFGLQASQYLFQIQFSRSAKESWLKESLGLASNAAFAYAKVNDLPTALATLEGGRARLLGEALERARRDLDHLKDIGHAELLEQYYTVSQRIEMLTRLASSESQPGTASTLPADWIQQVETAQAEIQMIIEQIRQVPGYETFLLSFSSEQIQAQAKVTPLIYLAATSAGGLALIVTPQDIQVIWLDSLTEKALREQVQGPDEIQALGSYLGAYAAWRKDPYHPATRQAWEQAIDTVTRWLWGVLMGPLTQALEKQAVTQAVLIPGGLLGLLPLHAAWTEAPGGRHYALDTICFTYAPSARSLQEGREIAARTLPDSLLAIDNPDSSLVASSEEIRTALAGFDHALHLAGGKASRQVVIEALPNYPVLHFSTHGQAGWNQPLQGGLLMADGSLTLDELLNLRLPGARLAVLSACETGVAGTKLPDEVVSLPAGLMQAGVAGVAASLWSVLDISTAMLMARFYELWRKDGLGLPEALRQAQLWLRDTTDGEKKAYFQSSLPEFAAMRMPAKSADAFFKAVVLNDDDAHSFAHPFHWAAFTYTGP